MKAPFTLRRGRCPHRPAKGETTPAFQSISGSGAGAETILHLRPLAKSSKRVGRTSTTSTARGALRIPKPWFWRRFLHTFCRCWQKVCRRRHKHPTTKNRTEAKASVRLHIMRKINYPCMRSQNARTRAVASSSPSTWIIPCRSGVFSRPVSAKRTKDDTSAMEPL